MNNTKVHQENPKVTVLMAVYNGERYLGEAIESILAQSFTDFEFIIINDGSTDLSRHIILTHRDPRIRLVDNSDNVGLTKSLNRGLALARGEYVARQDADDRSYGERLSRQVVFLDANPDIVLMGTQTRIIDENGKVVKGKGEHKALNHLGISYQLLFGNPFTHSSVMFRRSIILDKFSGYDESYWYNQDFELWSRVIAGAQTANLPDILVDFRNHSLSVSKPSTGTTDAFERNFIRNVAVQKQNILRILSDGYFLKWPELWSRLNVPFIKGYPCTPEVALDILPKIHAKFSDIHSKARNKKEIAYVTAQIYLRLSTIFASHNRKAAVRAFSSVFEYDYRQGILFLPEFVFRLARLEYLGRILKYVLINLRTDFLKD